MRISQQNFALILFALIIRCVTYRHIKRNSLRNYMMKRYLSYFPAKTTIFSSRIARTPLYYNWCHESLLDIPASRCRFRFYQIRFSFTCARSTRLVVDSARFFFSDRLRRQSLEEISGYPAKSSSSPCAKA